MDIKKIYISADGLLADSFRLAQQILASGFRPTHIVGVWRGGAPVGIAVQEYLEFKGIETDHISIRTASYTGIDEQADVHVYGEGYLVDTLNAEDRLLIIDDVFDHEFSVMKAHSCGGNGEESQHHGGKVLEMEAVRCKNGGGADPSVEG